MARQRLKRTKVAFVYVRVWTDLPKLGTGVRRLVAWPGGWLTGRALAGRLASCLLATAERCLLPPQTPLRRHVPRTRGQRVHSAAPRTNELLASPSHRTLRRSVSYTCVQAASRFFVVAMLQPSELEECRPYGSCDHGGRVAIAIIAACNTAGVVCG